MSVGTLQFMPSNSHTWDAPFDAWRLSFAGLCGETFGATGKFRTRLPHRSAIYTRCVMTDSIRLVSYNILEGLRPISSDRTDRRLIDRDRAGAVRAVIAELDPEILVLNEALFCRLHAGTAIDYGSLFDFPYQTAALYDEAWGNAILSRHPIAKSQEMRIYNRGGLVATIGTPLGQVTVASYHPHPGRYPENKANDFTRLVADLSGPVIICGDMNCISPEDDIDRNQLVAAFESFSDSAEVAVDRFIQSGKSVFDALGKVRFQRCCSCRRSPLHDADRSHQPRQEFRHAH